MDQFSRRQVQGLGNDDRYGYSPGVHSQYVLQTVGKEPTSRQHFVNGMNPFSQVFIHFVKVTSCSKKACIMTSDFSLTIYIPVKIAISFLLYH